MCGIAGYLSFARNLPDFSQLKLMCDRLVHRGPDDSGFYQDEFAGLGHRRLSVIDVVGGKQPLGNEDGSIQLVFNGEIYNYRELRWELLRRGHRFSTNSDTEVLVHLYEDVGDRLPEYLNGMFAFALWDTRKQVLFFARDRFGEKPLYYSLGAPGMDCCFASELQALTTLPNFPTRLNSLSIANFLSLSYIPDPETIYENVQKLKPAHCLKVTCLGARMWRYWNPTFNIDSSATLNDAAEALHALAMDAVKTRMLSDVPLGGFLSGGVDSSAVVACMTKHSPKRVKTFSIGFDEEQFDELPYARLIVNR